MDFYGHRLFAMLALAIFCTFVLRSAKAEGPAPAGAPSTSSATAPPATSASSDMTSSSGTATVGIGSKVDDLLNLDIDQLTKVKVSTNASKPTNANVPSSEISSGSNDFNDATTLGELARQAPSVSTRQTSSINIDPRVRGYNSSELNATANGVPEMKTRVDIDSAFSQVDPGIVDNVTIIDGPYTSLYGPGLAFLVADLMPTPRYENPEAHFATTFQYGTNGGTIYNRDTVVAGGANWGMCLSYGLRDGNDYLTGGNDPYRVSASYQKWDDFLALSLDVDRHARIEFNGLYTEMNNVQLPGIVYDLHNSKNDQFSARYVIQQDAQGPKQLVVQGWWNQTSYTGNSSDPSKQSFYNAFFTQPNYNTANPGDQQVETVGVGSLESMGVRLLRTFGTADSPQLTVGVDYRRTKMFYNEYDYMSDGTLAFSGDLFGIPRSQMDDVGALIDFLLPLSKQLSVTMGGRVDQCTATVFAGDPVITQISDPTQYYYTPGFTEPSKTLGMAYLTGKYKIDQQWTLKTGVGFGMIMPDLNELYTDEPYTPVARFGNSYTDGNSYLEPEKCLQFDVGIAYKGKTASFGVRGFYSIVDDYIMPVAAQVDPVAPFQQSNVLGRNFSSFPASARADLGTVNENADTNQAGYQYVNISEATFCGGDLFAEAKVNEWFTLFGNMAYVLGTNESPTAFLESSPQGYVTAGQKVPLGGTEGLPGMYPLNGTVGIRINEPTDDRWMVEFSSRMVDRQTWVAASQGEIPTSAFTVFNLRGYYRVNKHVRLTGDIENLFNTAYTEPGALAIIGPNGVPTFVQSPGFTAVLGIDARF